MTHARRPVTALVAAGVLLAAALAATPARAAAPDEAPLDALIAKHRQGDLAVRVPGIAGAVRYRLVKHHFPFGTCVNQSLLLKPDSDPDARRYRDLLARYFTCAVDESAMKWKHMEPEPGVYRDEIPLKVWAACRRLGLSMRGHCIMWGTNQGPAGWHKTVEPAVLEKAIKARMVRVLGLFKGKIDEWDLNNEMLHGDVYAKRLGLKNGAAYFKWAEVADPGVTYYVNDYGILGGGAKKYARHIQAMLDDGAPIGGIGCQAHFGGRVPPTETLWASLDTLAAFGLPIKITEFDAGGKDEAAQAEDLRRFYRVCFAHPAVKGILMWGFWEGRHWKPGRALWRKDWSIKPNGQAYVDLMERQWVTSGAAAAGRDGWVAFRGFYGTYRVEAGGRTWEVTLTPEAPRATAQPVADP